MRANRVAIVIKKAALEFDKLSNPVLAEYGLTDLVVLDLDSSEKYAVEPCKDAEAKFGSYPVYDEALDLIGNKGLIILEKTASNVKVMTCSGFYVPEDDEDQIIAKTTRLNMRIVNAAVLTDRSGRKFICTL